MAEIATLARPYAEAVFKLADESGRLEEWAQTLVALANVVRDAAVAPVIRDPQVTPEQLYELVLAGVRAELPAEVQNFVRVIIEKRRLPLLPVIREQFDRLKHEREGVVDADVTTAFPLEDGQLAELVRNLERRMRRKVSARVRVDRELIGGVQVVVGDEIIEGSVRGKLAAMAAALTRS